MRHVLSTTPELRAAGMDAAEYVASAASVVRNGGHPANMYVKALVQILNVSEELATALVTSEVEYVVKRGDVYVEFTHDDEYGPVPRSWLDEATP